MPMKEEKDDRRVKYTKRVIKESFIRLLQGKPVSKVTVKEICETADINRSTFYAHYSDQYDLLQQIKQEVLQEINSILSNYSFKKYEPESLQIMIRIFEYIVENAELCKVLLGENGDVSLQRELMMIIQQQGMKEWQDQVAVDARMREYLCLFGVNGGIGIVQKWLQTGLKESAREMAELVTKVTYRGFSVYS